MHFPMAPPMRAVDVTETTSDDVLATVVEANSVAAIGSKMTGKFMARELQK